MNKNLFTYKKSGVNIDAADKFVSFISSISSKKRGNKKNANIGGFGSVTDLPKSIKNPKIVACTDGVGTKIEIANLLKKYDIALVSIAIKKECLQKHNLRFNSNFDIIGDFDLVINLSHYYQF